MDAATRRHVRERAQLRCEYCHLAEINSPVAKLQVEHVRPRKHGGSDDLENLALACIDCNLRKGPNLAGIDPMTDEMTALFDPRRQVWEEHFVCKGIQLEGLTAVGRATIVVLDLNSVDRLLWRIADG